MLSETLCSFVVVFLNKLQGGFCFVGSSTHPTLKLACEPLDGTQIQHASNSACLEFKHLEHPPPPRPPPPPVDTTIIYPVQELRWPSV